jgi:hypothetical protein
MPRRIQSIGGGGTVVQFDVALEPAFLLLNLESLSKGFQLVLLLLSIPLPGLADLPAGRF